MHRVAFLSRCGTCLLLLGACGGEKTVTDPPRTYLTIAATTPRNGATDVPIETEISATFSQPVNSPWLQIEPLIGVNVSQSETRIVFTPIQPLRINTRYTVTPVIQDEAGDPSNLPSWSFTTRSGIPVSLTTVSTGNVHACGLDSNGEALCWGTNDYGQLGIGQYWPYALPTPVFGDIRFSSIVAGTRGSCALTSDGKAYCWGLNDHGELGNGTNLGRGLPTEVVGDERFATMALGFEHTCGVTAAGEAYCWGSNVFGALGSGAPPPGCGPSACTKWEQQLTPTRVSGGISFSTITSGQAFSCALDMQGAGYCWGYNYYGQLGDGTVATRWSPTPVSGGHTFGSISAGSFHSCGLVSTGEAYCWGYNAYGQLGDGTTDNRLVPVRVRSTVPFARISVGQAHTCALGKDGTAYCWGLSTAGALGIGSRDGPEFCGSPYFSQSACTTIPMPVTGGIVFTSISARADRTCGVASGGAVYCWGGTVTPPLPTRVLR